jgi:hypothetical protein
MQAALREFHTDLEAAGLIRKIPAERASQWDAIIEQWATSDLPLIVRRGGHPEMCMNIQHREGRMLAPSDNSPAHWMVIQCYSNHVASLDYVRSEFNRIPMTMRMSRKEASTCDYQIRLDDLSHAGSSGWYLAHIENVGLGKIGPLKDAPITKLQEHFRKLMRPSNMLLIASSISGLAEIDTFIA